MRQGTLHNSVGDIGHRLFYDFRLDIPSCRIWQFVLRQNVWMLTEIVFRSIVIATTMLMVAFAYIAREGYFSLIIYVSCETTLALTIRACVTITQSVFLQVKSILVHHRN